MEDSHCCCEIYGSDNLLNLLVEELKIKKEHLETDGEHLTDLVHHESVVLI
jgi:NADH:ubiquinone oxidoreductase subunit E